MFQFARIVAAVTMVTLCVMSAAAMAQNKATPPPRVTIPLEVALIYHKLLNVTPNFDQLAQYSPKLDNVGSFGRDALLAQEKSNLEHVFKNTKRDQLIVIEQTMAIADIDPQAERLSMKNLDGDTPFTFEVGDTTYGVFIRNTDFIDPIKGAFQKIPSWSSLINNYQSKRHVIVELLLRPRGADDTNFTTYDDRTVKPIITDLIDLKIIDPRFTNNMLLHKRDEKAFAEATKLEALVDEDLSSDYIPSFSP